MTPSKIASEKTSELIIYIASKLSNKPNYGAILLNKALYFVDCMYYTRNGKPLSDFTYIKQRLGPTPAPNIFLPLRDHLINIGELKKESKDYFGRKQERYIATREPKISIFTGEEIFLIDEVLELVADQNATEISDLTHLLDCWNIAEDKEELPFFTFLLNGQEPSPKVKAWAERVINKYEQKVASQ